MMIFNPYNYSILFADGEQEFGSFRDKKNQTLREISGEIYKAYAILRGIEPGAEVIIDCELPDTFEIWIGGRLVATIVVTR